MGTVMAGLLIGGLAGNLAAFLASWFMPGAGDVGALCFTLMGAAAGLHRVMTR